MKRRGGEPCVCVSVCLCAHVCWRYNIQDGKLISQHLYVMIKFIIIMTYVRKITFVIGVLGFYFFSLYQPFILQAATLSYLEFTEGCFFLVAPSVILLLLQSCHSHKTHHPILSILIDIFLGGLHHVREDSWRIVYGENTERQW